MTGQTKTVQIANRLGHSITYDEVLNIETVQANKAQLIINSIEHSILPIIPVSDTNSVSNVFWVDNFDTNLDTERGSGAINMSTIMTFQEINDGAIRGDMDVNFEKDRSRFVTSTFAHKEVAINGKQEPSCIPFKHASSASDEPVYLFISDILCGFSYDL